MSELRNSARLAVILGVLSLAAIVLSHLALTDIAHGEPDVIAGEMRRMAWDRGVGVRVAITGTQTAAWLLAHVRPGTTVVAPGDEANVLARLPITALSMLPECTEVPGFSPGRVGTG